MSPAAQMPGMLVSRYESTPTPRSTAMPACSECRLRPHADADDDKVGVELFPALQGDAVPIERSGCGTEVEDDAVLLVDLAHEVADFPAEHVFHRACFGCDDMHLEPPRP